MNQNELWAAYVARNPDFGKPDAVITLKASGLKKLFDQTWDKAHEAGVENGRALEKLSGSSRNPFDFFGKR